MFGVYLCLQYTWLAEEVNNTVMTSACLHYRIRGIPGTNAIFAISARPGSQQCSPLCPCTNVCVCARACVCACVVVWYVCVLWCGMCVWCGVVWCSVCLYLCACLCEMDLCMYLSVCDCVWCCVCMHCLCPSLFVFMFSAVKYVLLLVLHCRPAQQVSAPTMQLCHHPLALAGVPVPKQKAGCAKRKSKLGVRVGGCMCVCVCVRVVCVRA